MTDAQRAAAQELFLSSFRRLGNVTMGCQVAGISRTTFYAWLEKDVAFTVQYHQAEEEAADVLEAEAWRRAVKGTEKVVVSMGKIVRAEDGKPLTERAYSDTLLLNLLRAHHKRYRPQPLDGQNVSTIRVIIETDTREVPGMPGMAQCAYDRWQRYVLSRRHQAA